MARNQTSLMAHLGLGSADAPGILALAQKLPVELAWVEVRGARCGLRDTGFGNGTREEAAGMPLNRSSKYETDSKSETGKCKLETDRRPLAQLISDRACPT